jgi:hypothetical protein
MFLDRFSKNVRTSNFMQVRLVRAELLYADGQTDTTNLIVSFHNFANAPKNYTHAITFDGTGTRCWQEDWTKDARVKSAQMVARLKGTQK